MALVVTYDRGRRRKKAQDRWIVVGALELRVVFVERMDFMCLCDVAMRSDGRRGRRR